MVGPFHDVTNNILWLIAPAGQVLGQSQESWPSAALMARVFTPGPKYLQQVACPRGG